jgi:integron integrase
VNIHVIEARMESSFLNSVRRSIRTLHYSIRTEQAYLSWIRQYILFHNKRHPSGMGVAEVGKFLSYLANERHVSAATQNQALNALNFLYTQVLGLPLGDLQGVARAKRPKRLPVVLTQREINLLLDHLSSAYLLMAKLMYGSGLRLMEVLRLRIKDVDFERHAIVVRAGKGDKDRITVLPDSLVPYLRIQLEHVRLLHKTDLEAGFGETSLPYALARKYPNAPFQAGWQYVFPAANRAREPRSGRIKRHHIHRSSVQNAVRHAVRQAGLEKPASSHSYGTVLQRCVWNRVLTSARYRNCLATRMIYTHVLNRGDRGVRSPLDR